LPTTAAEPIHLLPGASTGLVQQGWKSVEQLMAERRARGWAPGPSLAKLPLAVDILRADRDSR
jgi:hypothetical protein